MIEKNCETCGKGTGKHDHIFHVAYICPNCGSVRVVSKGEELSRALTTIRDEIFKALKIPRFAVWLNKVITRGGKETWKRK